ncbi:MAG: hypothetical protein V2J19_06250 [Wenzhouxiangella sp.]|nr:hypothetical protein [Wenzhouxiangella sp.]
MTRFGFKCLILASLLLTLTAHGRPIEAGVTGNWYDPQQPGHGLQIEILDLSRAVVAWYTFDADGRPLWLFGNGSIEGDTIRAELHRYGGTRFPPDFDAGEIEGELWGRIVFRRTGCDSAAFSYTPEDGTYQPAEFPLERLTRIDGMPCSEQGPWPQQRRWTPTAESSGFEALFLDYPAGREDRFNLESGVEPLPEPWDERYGLRISGNNASDDLMMVLMRPVDGLEPDTRYDVELEMQFATNEPSGCTGVGGSPGESVFMRLGAAGEQPGAVIVDDYRRASIDLGQQANPGERALSAGNMANGADESFCTRTDAPWRLKRVSTTGQEFSVTSDETGRIWVYGLSDSAFEATTTWYLTEFVLRLAETE